MMKKKTIAYLLYRMRVTVALGFLAVFLISLKYACGEAQVSHVTFISMLYGTN
jgi:hypothetical protein